MQNVSQGKHEINKLLRRRMSTVVSSFHRVRVVREYDAIFDGKIKSEEEAKERDWRKKQIFVGETLGGV
jgi:hypothetical protein